MAEHHLDKGKSNGRERLIKAAQTLTQHSPFDEITIDEIVKQAELSRPAFYYHFTGGKEELRAELVRTGIINAPPAHDIHQTILEAALRVFARSGISAATLDEIATEAGVSRGAVCWHFRNKDDLLSAVIEHSASFNMLRETIDQIEQELHTGGPIDDETILRRIAEGIYDSFSTQGNLTRLSILLIHTHPEAAQIIADRIIKGRKKIISYVEKRQEEGYFRKDIDAALFVQMLATIFVMRTIWRGLSDLLPFAHLSREEVTRQVVSTLLYGIAQTDQAKAPISGT